MARQTREIGAFSSICLCISFVDIIVQPIGCMIAQDAARGILICRVGAWRSLVARPEMSGRPHVRLLENLVGAWRSLVARFHGVEEVARSNRVAPTRF